MPRPRKSARPVHPDTAADAASDHLPATETVRDHARDAAPTPAPVLQPAPPVPAAPVKKTDLVLTLLGREQGATVAEMMAVTGWLAHTTRAALTGLRKKGHVLVRTKRDDVTCYRLAAAD